MEKIKIRRRIHGTLSSAQKRHIEKARQATAEELPDLLRRNNLRFAARKEKTFSGLLRRAVHGFRLSPMKVAERAAIGWSDFSFFLTGEKSLPSDAIDRLVRVLKVKVLASKPRTRPAKAG